MISRNERCLFVGHDIRFKGVSTLLKEPMGDLSFDGVMISLDSHLSPWRRPLRPNSPGAVHNSMWLYLSRISASGLDIYHIGEGEGWHI